MSDPNGLLIEALDKLVESVGGNMHHLDAINRAVAEIMTPEQVKIVEEMGFEICTFGPDSDPCEECKRTGKQLYFSGPTDAGTYLCLDCILAAHIENEKHGAEIMRLEQEGHDAHCAARHVWGDGECECGKQGIIPGPVTRMILESC